MVDDWKKFQIVYAVSGFFNEEDADESDEYSERQHNILTFITFSNVKRDILSEIERFEDVFSANDSEDRPSKVFVYFQSMFENVTLYYILYQDLIDYYSMRLLHDELIAEEYLGSNKSYELFKGLNQREREQLLKRSGILDHKYTDKMKKLRLLRNNLVHSPTKRLSPGTIEGLIDNIDAAANVLEVLHTRVEEDPYWPDSTEDFLDWPI